MCPLCLVFFFFFFIFFFFFFLFFCFFLSGILEAWRLGDLPIRSSLYIWRPSSIAYCILYAPFCLFFLFWVFCVSFFFSFVSTWSRISGAPERRRGRWSRACQFLCFCRFADFFSRFPPCLFFFFFSFFFFLVFYHIIGEWLFTWLLFIYSTRFSLCVSPPPASTFFVTFFSVLFSCCFLWVRQVRQEVGRKINFLFPLFFFFFLFFFFLVFSFFCSVFLPTTTVGDSPS